MWLPAAGSSLAGPCQMLLSTKQASVCEQRFGKCLVLLLRPWSQPADCFLMHYQAKPSSRHLGLAHSCPGIQDREADGWPKGAKCTVTGIALRLGCLVLLGEDEKLFSAAPSL